jgi:hypothetical protein
LLSSEDVFGPKNPILGIFGDGCARAAKGHTIIVAATLTKSRRLMRTSADFTATMTHGDQAQFSRVMLIKNPYRISAPRQPIFSGKFKRL